MTRKFVVEKTMKAIPPNEGAIAVRENGKVRLAYAEELEEILDEFYAEPIDALSTLRERILLDKNTFVNCGRKDTLGFDRSIMLLDEMITEIKESNYGMI